jgi:uncharacterized tellurite resistance protein B-like protein
MFFRKADPATSQTSELEAVVARAIPGTDQATQRIVTAIVGLSGVVAYADRDFSDVEQRALRGLLATIEGMTERGARDVVTTLETQIIAVSSTEMTRHARALVELGERELRLRVLELLLDLAAADESVSQEEVVVLRQVTKAMGLDQAEYNALQERHKALLAALR